MHVLLIVVGLLLLLFGGGCTLIIGGFTIADPGTLTTDPSLLGMLLIMGILPLGLGWWLFRWGLRIDRERRRPQAPPQDGGTAQ